MGKSPMSSAALAVGLIAEAIKVGIDLYQAQGMSEQQARELVLRDMDAAARNAGLAEAGWAARKRPATSSGDDVLYVKGQPAPGSNYLLATNSSGAVVWRPVSLAGLPAETIDGDVVAVVPGEPIREHIASEDMPTDPTATGPANQEDDGV